MLASWRYKRRRPQQPRARYGNLIAYMQRRLEGQPSDMRLRLSLVSHLKMAGRYEEAIRQAEHILQRDPTNRRAKTLLLRLRVDQRLAFIQRGLRQL
jgi:Flp pilus assembly protein TadD